MLLALKGGAQHWFWVGAGQCVFQCDPAAVHRCRSAPALVDGIAVSFSHPAELGRKLAALFGETSHIRRHFRRGRVLQPLSALLIALPTIRDALRLLCAWTVMRLPRATAAKLRDAIQRVVDA